MYHFYHWNVVENTQILNFILLKNIFLFPQFYVKRFLVYECSVIYKAYIVSIL